MAAKEAPEPSTYMVEYRLTKQSDGYWHLWTPGSSHSVIKSKNRAYLVWFAATVAAETNSGLTVSPHRPAKSKRTSLAGLEALFGMLRVISSFLDVAEKVIDPGRLSIYALQAHSSLDKVKRFLPEVDSKSAFDLAAVISMLESRITELRATPQATAVTDASVDERLSVAC